MKNIIYLSGASACLEDEGRTWRRYTKQLLDENTSYECFIPNDYFDYSKKMPSTDKECMNYFLHRLKHSSLVVVNLANTKKSVGTGIELALAREWGIPIIGFNQNETSYPWSIELCDVVLNSISDVENYINYYY